MQNFKTLLIVVLALVVASCGSLKLPDPYHVNPNPLVNKGGKVSFTVKDTIPAKAFPKKEIVKLEPYLKYEGGQLNLKPMTLKGEKAIGDGTVVNFKTGGSFTYSETFDYKPEMQVSELWVKATSLKGGKETVLADVKISEGTIVTGSRVGHGENVQMLPHAYQKEVIANKTGKIYFEYNKSNYNSALKLNKDSQALMDSLKKFMSNGWTVKDITINAWASPEGELTLNQELSDERGATAKKFFEGEVKKMKLQNLPAPTVTAKGADYDGFMAALNASTIEDKGKIENVIKSQANKADREQQIRNMTIIYKEVEDMLSVLRRADFSINSYEPRRTDAEIAELSVKDPQTLSLQELLYAATLTEDLNTQLSIYKAAIQKNDQCVVAYNNAGAIDIKLGNLEEASKLLEKAASIKANNPQVQNNLGVIAAYNKDYPKAKTYYNNAKSGGVDVSYNMGVIQMIEGDYAAAEQSFASKKCDYNLGLAQLQNGKTAEATKTLDCAPKTGEVYYLLAIVGARTNNTSMVIDNLRLAIQAVPGYKSEAKMDKEFRNFQNNADFQNLIK
jgi:tetratricopeptide (TPR) repeat protein